MLLAGSVGQSDRPANMFVTESDQPGRRCARCRMTKPVDYFAWRRSKAGQLDTYCRPCRSAYGKEHYAANRQRYIDQTAVRKRLAARERTAYILEFFKRHPCHGLR